MARNGILAAGAGLGVLAAAGFLWSQEPADDLQQLTVSDPVCTFFGPKHDQYVAVLTGHSGGRLAELTNSVTRRLAPAPAVMESFAAAAASGMPSAPGGSRTGTLQHPSSNTIDTYINQALNDAKVAKAPPATDYEFVRRIYLDLTGRIPTPAQVLSFVNDATLDKRSTLIDSLIGSSNWIDKWTIWFGDQLSNNSRNTQIPRYVPGVMGFNDYIRTSLTNNKKYDQMTRELIAAAGNDSFTQGELNFNVGSEITNGPFQDTFDQKAADTFETFMGISHLNCLLCHNGRGHLDALSLWGSSTTRMQAWGVASFFSHTVENRNPVAGAVNGQPYYWSVQDNVPQRGARTVTDYQLNTTTGNRPTRSGATPTATVAPVYIFNGGTPGAGETYRAALGRMITSDFQFARATVNYMWAYFFGIGIVDPPNQFDPLRLDPDNPPEDCLPNVPCTLQASNPRLLNALASDFVASGYDIRALQREITNSQTYQLSSRYTGTWDPATANLFGRKLVRRLWAEEIHDAVAQSSAVIPAYAGAIGNNFPGVTAWGPVNWAMKFPEPFNTPDNGGAVSQFLDAFLRGNRDDEARSGDGSISQALDLMNDNFIISRVRSTASTSLIQTALKLPNDQLVNTLFLTVLSRYPTASEMTTAMANLGTASTRTAEAQNLLWALYNKVDFTFNY